MTLEQMIELMKADEVYREGWRDQIAAAIYDTRKRPGEYRIDWCDRCAETFLNRLCGEPNR